MAASPDFLPKIGIDCGNCPTIHKKKPLIVLREKRHTINGIHLYLVRINEASHRPLIRCSLTSFQHPIQKVPDVAPS